MQKIKKIMSLLMTSIMLFAQSTTAFAYEGVDPNYDYSDFESRISKNNISENKIAKRKIASSYIKNDKIKSDINYYAQKHDSNYRNYDYNGYYDYNDYNTPYNFENYDRSYNLTDTFFNTSTFSDSCRYNKNVCTSSYPLYQDNNYRNRVNHIRKYKDGYINSMYICYEYYVMDGACANTIPYTKEYQYYQNLNNFTDDELYNASYKGTILDEVKFVEQSGKWNMFFPLLQRTHTKNLDTFMSSYKAYYNYLVPVNDIKRIMINNKRSIHPTFENFADLNLIANYFSKYGQIYYYNDNGQGYWYLRLSNSDNRQRIYSEKQKLVKEKRDHINFVTNDGLKISISQDYNNLNKIYVGLSGYNGIEQDIYII